MCTRLELGLGSHSSSAALQSLGTVRASGPPTLRRQSWFWASGGEEVGPFGCLFRFLGLFLRPVGSGLHLPVWSLPEQGLCGLSGKREDVGPHTLKKLRVTAAGTPCKVRG